MIALLEAQRAGLLTRAHLVPNLVAGLVVGIVAMPLAMAFAIASGATPAQGLYTAIVAGLATALLGGTRVQISGPTGAFIAVLAGITAQYGIAGLQAATLMAGVILLVMGLARLGSVIKLHPEPGDRRLHGRHRRHHLGRPVEGFLRTAPGRHPACTSTKNSWRCCASFPHLHLRDHADRRADTRDPHRRQSPVLRACRGLERVPAPLLAMLAAMARAGVSGSSTGVATIGSAFGGIPRALPGFSWPAICRSRTCLQLVGPAFAIALLGAIESLLTAVVADGMTGARHDSNQELIGQGVANIICAAVRRFRRHRRHRAHRHQHSQWRHQPAGGRRACRCSCCW